jgi:thiosulfate dehydrogenase (quinone) large subunit
VEIDRKQFLVMAASVVAGIRPAEASGETGPIEGGQLVDAGPVENYAADGVHDAFRSHGFFVIRHGEKLFALSAICTHRRCKISPERDRTFTCDCHGSTFDADGHVETGPAKKDLPVLPSFISGAKHLMVRVPI